MEKKQEKIKEDLRSRAEKAVADYPPGQAMTAGDRGDLHELQVHQIELELQNEELVRAQLELEKARTRLMFLYHNAPVGYVVLDSSGLIKQSNATFAGMINLDFKLLTGKPFVQYLEKADQPIFRGRYKTFFQNPENKRMELRLLTHQRNSCFVRLEGVPNSQRGNTPDSDGFDELLMTVSNITREKLNEQKVELLNLILLSITSVNQLIVRQKNRSSLIHELCQTLIKARGFFNAWILLLDQNQSFIEWAHGGLEEESEHFEKNMNAGIVPFCMRRALEKSGVIVTTNPGGSCPLCPLSHRHQNHGALTIRLEQDGKILGILCLSTNTDMMVSEGLFLVEELARDISFALQDISKEEENIRIQRALKESEERLAVTLRSIGDGVITTDIQGKVVLINKAAEDLTGWSQQEGEGKPLDEVFIIMDEFTRNPCKNSGKKVLETGEIIELTNHTLLVSRNGRERIITDRGAPLKDSQDQIIGVVLVFSDVTEKIRVEEQIQRTEKLESLGQLAGGIAHDFNNILGGIFGYMDLARQECQENDNVSSYLDEAMGIYDRARDLTRQLLTFSKGGAPVKKSGNITALIRNSTHPILAGSPVVSKFDIPRSLYPCDYDEDQMGQVISNLVLNARQAMPQGGTIQIKLHNVELDNNEIGLLPGGNYLCISLSDQGVGIPQEQIGRIFDPFFTTREKASGLGLTTSYSIIQKHNGHISVESSEGKGTRFTIYLPASEKKQTTEKIRTPFSYHGRGNILVMDDEVFIREILSAHLKSAGYTVMEAATGEEALAVFDQFKKRGEIIKAAIFDLTIPAGMGGRETAKKIREVNQDVAIFASSGYSDDPVIADPKAYGFNDSIRKPFRQQDLYDLLARNLVINSK